jgi:hypothetical protein
MTLTEITDRIDGKVICCEYKDTINLEYAFASDLMSDVLTVEKDNLILITGLANLQTIRTAEMSDISCIIFGRDKKIGEDIIALAKENCIILVVSPYSVFHISGELYKAGIKPIY